jgi:sortase B
MKNGSMFASLHKYSDQTYFEEHSYIWYLTPQGNYRINVISGFIENAVAPVYGLFEDEESFREFVDYAIAKSDFQSRYDYSKAEHLMVLSTCSYEYDDARYIIVGIPIPESK